jgi:hypothetical protein
MRIAEDAARDNRVSESSGWGGGRRPPLRSVVPFPGGDGDPMGPSVV